METLKSFLNEFAILRLTGNGFKNPTSFNRPDEEEIDIQDVDDPIKFNNNQGQEYDTDDQEDITDDSEGVEIDPTNGCNCKCCQKWHNFFTSLYDKEGGEDDSDDVDLSDDAPWKDRNGDGNELRSGERREDDDIEDEQQGFAWAYPH